jgi:hypothetical protein
VSFYVSTATLFLLHCDEWDRVVALPRHKFVKGATLLQLGVKLRKYFRGQVGPHQINFGSPSGTHSSPATSLARCPTAGGPLKAPGSPGINGVKSCILAISWQQNWPFRNYNLIQKITNFQNIFLKIKLFCMHQYTMTSEIYSWSQISGRFRAWHMVWMFVACTSCSKWIFIFFVLCNMYVVICIDFK